MLSTNIQSAPRSGKRSRSRSQHQLLSDISYFVNPTSADALLSCSHSCLCQSATLQFISRWWQGHEHSWGQDLGGLLVWLRFGRRLITRNFESCRLEHSSYFTRTAPSHGALPHKTAAPLWSISTITLLYIWGIGATLHEDSFHNHNTTSYGVILQTNKLPLPKCFGIRSATSSETLHDTSCHPIWDTSLIGVFLQFTHTNKKSQLRMKYFFFIHHLLHTPYFFSTSSVLLQIRPDQTRPDQPNHMATAKPQGSQLWSDDHLAFENETWNLHMIVRGDKRKHLSLSSGFTYITQALQDSCLVCRGPNQLPLSRPWHTKLGKYSHSHMFVRGYHDPITFLPFDKQSRRHFHTTLSRKTVRIERGEIGPIHYSHGLILLQSHILSMGNLGGSEIMSTSNRYFASDPPKHWESSNITQSSDFNHIHLHDDSQLCVELHIRIRHTKRGLARDKITLFSYLGKIFFFIPEIRDDILLYIMSAI